MFLLFSLKKYVKFHGQAQGETLSGPLDGQVGGSGCMTKIVDGVLWFLGDVNVQQYLD